MFHNELHCRTSFSHPFFLEVLFVALIFMNWISHFLIDWLVYLVLTNSSILAQPENNAADRQISMIIVIISDKS